MTHASLDAVYNCNMRILFLLKRDGINADKTNIQQIQLLRDHIRFAHVSY